MEQALGSGSSSSAPGVRRPFKITFGELSSAKRAGKRLKEPSSTFKAARSPRQERNNWWDKPKEENKERKVGLITSAHMEILDARQQAVKDAKDAAISSLANLKRYEEKMNDQQTKSESVKSLRNPGDNERELQTVQSAPLRQEGVVNNDIVQRLQFQLKVWIRNLRLYPLFVFVVTNVLENFKLLYIYIYMLVFVYRIWTCRCNSKETSTWRSSNNNSNRQIKCTRCNNRCSSSKHSSSYSSSRHCTFVSSS
jgi:hypothetical protein